MKKRSWLLVVALGTAFSAPMAAGAQIEIDHLPRPVAKTPAADKIAATLAAKDTEFRRDAADCHAEAGQRGFWYQVGARRLLETSTLYSVEIAANWYCGGAYPDRNATALTFDMQTGMPYDLTRAFHVGNDHLADAVLPILANYMKPGGDCADVTSKDDLQRAGVSLGVTKTYLIFYFEVIHAIAACYVPVQVPLAALASVANPPELRRLGPPFAVLATPPS